MAKTMDTKYDHLAVEKDIYSKWVKKVILQLVI